MAEVQAEPKPLVRLVLPIPEQSDVGQYAATLTFDPLTQVEADGRRKAVPVDITPQSISLPLTP